MLLFEMGCPGVCSTTVLEIRLFAVFFWGWCLGGDENVAVIHVNIIAFEEFSLFLQGKGRSPTALESRWL